MPSNSLTATIAIGAAPIVLLGLSAVAAVAYGIFFLNRPPSLLRAVIKTAFMAALAAALALSGIAPTLLLVAAIASAVGDAALAFDKPWVLPFGILSFLIAQVSYLVLFLGRADAHEFALARYAAIALIVLVSIGFLVWLWPKLGKLAFGVVPYSLAIAAMVSSAMMLPLIASPAMIGALLFFVSDGTLSAELFQLPPDAGARRITAPIVWWTYAAAQVLIIWGMLRDTANF